ncbi:MAG TPA: hypothetical protein VHW90_11020 [Stellaceae bacterium]|jgi:hypothetical protein|nr:hypothetical protein [Stellaceae bacterium]
MKNDDPVAVALAALEMCEALIQRLAGNGTLSRQDVECLVNNLRKAREPSLDRDQGIPRLTQIEVGIY